MGEIKIMRLSKTQKEVVLKMREYSRCLYYGGWIDVIKISARQIHKLVMAELIFVVLDPEHPGFLFYSLTELGKTIVL